MVRVRISLSFCVYFLMWRQRRWWHWHWLTVSRWVSCCGGLNRGSTTTSTLISRLKFASRSKTNTRCSASVATPTSATSTSLCTGKYNSQGASVPLNPHFSLPFSLFTSYFSPSPSSPLADSEIREASPSARSGAKHWLAIILKHFKDKSVIKTSGFLGFSAKSDTRHHAWPRFLSHQTYGRHAQEMIL